MSCCNIADGSFFENLINQNDLKINIDRLKTLIEADYQLVENNITKQSGIWYPLLTDVTSFDSYDLLIKSQISETYDPCNCKPSTVKYSGELKNNLINCKYCFSDETVTNASEWTLQSSDTNYRIYSSTCDTTPVTHKDIRANNSDLFPYIPVLNNSYIDESSIIDSKYSGKFPYVENRPIGFQGFAKTQQTISNKFFNLDRSSSVCIDWKINAKMGEIPFNGNDTHHKDVDTHIKSYDRFLHTNKTCGNFIFLDPFFAPESASGLLNFYKLNRSGIPCFNTYKSAFNYLPTDEEFTIPYGLKMPTINNVFINKKKDVSHWVWDYSAAVLCWYRYSSTENRSTDQRPIKGFDLYISDGDVFWANINSQEPRSSPEQNQCPRGIRAINENNEIKYVLPDGSKCIYISKNIYSKFLKILNRLENHTNGFLQNLSIIDKINTAAIQATGPSFDEITLDTFKTKTISTTGTFNISNLVNFTTIQSVLENNIERALEIKNQLSRFISQQDNNPESVQNDSYILDNFGQNKKAIAEMSSKNNQNMSQLLNISSFAHQPSVSKLNYIYNTGSLLQTLANKYGSYLLINSPALTNIDLKNNQLPNFAISMDFEMCPTRQFPTGAPSRNPLIVGYDQTFSFSSSDRSASKTLRTQLPSNDDVGQFKAECVSGVLLNAQYAKFASLLINNEIIKRIPLSGQLKFNDTYYRGSYDLALKIDGERLCSQFALCDDNLYKKYRQLLPTSVTPIRFTNNDIRLNRSYNILFHNPNIDNMAIAMDRGLYYESNIYGTGVRFLINDDGSDNEDSTGRISISFKPTNCQIKIYDISIEKLRSSSGLSCKTLPITDRCQCMPIEKSEFIFNDNIINNPRLWIPDISTANFTIKSYGGRSGSDPIFVNSAKPPIFDERGFSANVPKLSRYQDPEYKGCPSTHSVSLPIYTRTNWSLTFNNFNLYNHRVWASVSDSTPLTAEQNKIQVNVNSISIFSNQERALTDNYPPTLFSTATVELFNNKYIGAMAQNPGPILYQPLQCSAEGGQIHNINIAFKYLPDQHLIYFKQTPPIRMGALQSAKYSSSGGLNNSSFNDTKILYDSKTHLFSFSDESTNNRRYAAPITQGLMSILENLKFIDNPKINLHIKSGNRWFTVKADYFGYYYNKDKYSGYPFFYEYVSSSKNKKLDGFLSSFKLKNPDFLYEYKLLNQDFVYENEVFKNFVNLDGVKAYFRIPSLAHIYHDYNLAAGSSKTNLIQDLYHGFIKNNLLLDNNKDILANSVDTLIAREDCYASVRLYKGSASFNAKILTKYIFKSRKDGRFYTSLRLLLTNQGVPFNSSSVNDYLVDWSSLTTPTTATGNELIKLDAFTITRSIPNIVSELDPILKNNKWADVYGFDVNFRSFDATNKLDYFTNNPPLLTYDNILYDLYLYNYIYSLSYNQIPPFSVPSNNLSAGPRPNLPYATGSFVSLLSYFYTEENNSLLREEKDYLYPFVDLNFFTKNSLFSSRTGISSGNINFTNFKSIKYPQNSNNQFLDNGQYNPNYNLGYFWIDIPDQYVKYETIETTAHSTTFKTQQPDYFVSANISQPIIENRPNGSRIIRPSFAFYSDNKTFDTKYLSEPYIEYPIYYHKNLTQGCSNDCGMGIAGKDRLVAEYAIDSSTHEVSLSNPTDYFISIGNGSYYHYPYINRNILPPPQLSNVFPGKNSQGDMINDNRAPFFPDNKNDLMYGNNILNLTKTQLNVDIIANEMLYRLYYGSLQNINTATVGRRSLSTYLKHKRLSSFKNLIENNNDVLANEIYDLIPYEYDDKADTNNFLKFNGNITIYGIYKPGDNINISIGGTTYNISVEEDADAIRLVINNNFRSTLITKRTQSSTLHTVSVGNGAAIPQNTETTTYTKIGSCTTYIPKYWGVFAYFTNYTPDGVSLYDRYTKCQEVYDHYTQVNGFAPARLSQAVGAYADTFGEDVGALSAYIGPAIIRGVSTPVFICGQCPCLDEFCSNHGIYPDGPFSEGTIVAVQSTHGVAPGGRATYAASMCIGGNAGPCYPRPAGAPDMISPSFYAGDPDQIAGGYNPRDPFPIPMVCQYTGCGPQCLDINYQDKFGNEVYLNKIRQPGLLSDAGIPSTPCQCVPYEIINCEKPEDESCYSCINREQNKYSYNFEHENYNFNSIPASVTRDVTNTTPSLTAQQSIRFPDFSDCQYDWSPIDSSGPNNATEVCGFTENPSTQNVYDIYQRVDTMTTTPELPLCHTYLIGIEYSNNEIIFNCPNGERFCITRSTMTSCPVLNVQVPQDNDRYYFTNNITSECSDCGNKHKSINITNNQQPVWETIVENRVMILGIEPLEGDINYTVVGGGAGYVDRPLCGANVFEPCCWDGCYNGYGGPRQCGKNAPDSWTWKYCLECNIPGSRAPELRQQRGGSSTYTFIYGGIVTDCLGFVFPSVSSPQIKGQYFAEWQKRMRLKYRDVAPCHNNKSINVANLIEGVIPNSCSLEFTTISYPGLAYRRTRDGAESNSFSLGVHVAYIRYQYKRPKNIQDVLFDEPLCNDYNNGNSYMPETKNMVEKIINGGLCNREIICKDESVERCDESNVCCKLNIGHTQ
jgi:hypothetical protein